MSHLDHLLEQHAQSYATRQGLPLQHTCLGFGQDGTVWQFGSDVATVVKAFAFAETYNTEKACYLRLQECSVSEIDGFIIPELLGWDDELLVLEISYVSPPYIIDFGKCYLDTEPDYTEEVKADDERKYHDIWGDDDRWKQIKRLMRKLKMATGIYYQDPKPGNIRFANWEPDI